MPRRKPYTWDSIYQIWKSKSIYHFSELLEDPIRHAEIVPEYRAEGERLDPEYTFDWVPKGIAEKRIQSEVARCTKRGLPMQCIDWNKGALCTAAILSDCSTPEDRAALWLTAFILDMSDDKDIARSAVYPEILHVCCTRLSAVTGLWHGNMKHLFPENYTKDYLTQKKIDASPEVIIEYAVLNAALVLANYQPVEYIMY